MCRLRQGIIDGRRCLARSPRCMMLAICEITSLVGQDLGRQTVYSVNSVEAVERRNPRPNRPDPTPRKKISQLFSYRYVFF